MAEISLFWFGFVEALLVVAALLSVYLLNERAVALMLVFLAVILVFLYADAHNVHWLTWERLS